ncbi:hypothetical protein BURKHO8Y_60013 [Burkholderia sp. 8Y]|nr:hypothetical protein BURKHO8Y_60013 [Burkholderia sp. 8Y]
MLCLHADERNQGDVASPGLQCLSRVGWKAKNDKPFGIARAAGFQ